MTTQDILVAVLIGLMALLYSSVGHAGSSGFQAAMALMGVAAAVMKPTALTLNILVAVIGTVRFYRAGCFSWPLFWRFAAGSLPFALLGGRVQLPDGVYKQIVGVVLLYAAYRLFRQTMASRASSTATAGANAVRIVPAPLALGCGAGIGLLSGLTGTGGGIFLSPLLRLMGWSDMRHTAGVSVAFILVNSLAGLAGQLSTSPTLPSALPLWAAAAVIGGLIGSELGSRRLNNASLTRLLALVLVIAGVKLAFLSKSPHAPQPPSTRSAAGRGQSRNLFRTALFLPSRALLSEPRSSFRAATVKERCGRHDRARLARNANDGLPRHRAAVTGRREVNTMSAEIRPER